MVYCDCGFLLYISAFIPVVKCLWVLGKTLSNKMYHYYYCFFILFFFQNQTIGFEVDPYIKFSCLGKIFVAGKSPRWYLWPPPVHTANMFLCACCLQYVLCPCYKCRLKMGIRLFDSYRMKITMITSGSISAALVSAWGRSNNKAFLRLLLITHHVAACGCPTRV